MGLHAGDGIGEQMLAAGLAQDFELQVQGLFAGPATSVTLPAADAYALWAIVRKGTHKSRKITRVRALLLMGAGQGRLAVQTAAGVSANQYYTLKRRYLT